MPHNEWLAAQGLLNLSEDQPKQGDIYKLCEDYKKKKENKHVTETTADDTNDDVKTDDSTSMQDKQNVNVATDKSEGKSDDCTNQEQVNSTTDDSKENETINKNEPEKVIHKNVEKVQKPVPLKRQQYVKGRMSLKTCPFVKTKSNKIVRAKQTLQTKVQNQSTEKDENKEIVMEKRNMESIHAEVENILKDGKRIEECVKRKETLENILETLNHKSEGDKNIETKEIHKIDEAKTNEVVDCEVTEKTVELKVIVDDPEEDFNVNKEIKKEDSSDEFSSSNSSLKNIQEDISKLIDVENSNSKATKKSVSFEISTCAQLDKSAEEEAVETAGDDILSVNDFVIK